MTNIDKTTTIVCIHICFVVNTIMAAIITYAFMTHSDIAKYFPILITCAVVVSGSAGAACAFVQDIRSKREEDKKTQDITDA